MDRTKRASATRWGRRAITLTASGPPMRRWRRTLSRGSSGFGAPDARDPHPLADPRPLARWDLELPPHRRLQRPDRRDELRAKQVKRPGRGLANFEHYKFPCYSRPVVCNGHDRSGHSGSPQRLSLKLEEPVKTPLLPLARCTAGCTRRQPCPSHRTRAAQ